MSKVVARYWQPGSCHRGTILPEVELEENSKVLDDFGNKNNKYLEERVVLKLFFLSFYNLKKDT